MNIEHLGPYRILRKLGEGGMGVVYRGLDEASGNPAAIKILHAHMGQREGFRLRFEAEIESLRKLDHPHIVRLLGFGEDRGVLFYAMELVEGQSLEDELAAGRTFTWQQVIQIGIQIAQALRHAHDRGVIHRDIKPANLIITPSGHVKLSDFGIARLWGITSMTIDGGIVGTAHYMAPEQVEGKTITHRTDLYSLGCVLYALLAGRPPFNAKSLAELLRQQVSVLPDPVRKYAPAVPMELELVIARLLEKAPANRIPNANVFERSLQMVERAILLRESEQSAELQALTDDQDAAEAQTIVRGGAAELHPTIAADASAAGAATQPMVPDNASDQTVDASVNQPGPPTTTVVAAVESAQAPGHGLVDPAPDGQQVNESRFLTVEQAAQLDAQSTDDPEDGPRVLLVQAIAVGLATMLLLGGVWWLFRPPTADALYVRVTAAAAADGDIDSLMDVEVQLLDFMRLYPDDPRTEELRRYEDEIELARLERRLLLRSRRLAQTDTSSPVERAYLEAISQAQASPEQGMLKLQAILDLYGRADSPTPDDTEQYLELARRQQQRLQAQISEHAGGQIQAIRAGLTRARQLAAADPQQAQRIARAIVELYRDKPWAAELVQQADQLIGQLTAAPARR